MPWKKCERIRNTEKGKFGICASDTKLYQKSIFSSTACRFCLSSFGCYCYCGCGFLQEIDHGSVQRLQTVQINPKSRMNTMKGRVEHNLSYAKWISFEYIQDSRWPFKIHKIMLDLTASSGCRPRYLTCENRPWFFWRSFSRIFIEIFDIFSMGNREMFINSNNCFLILSLVADVIKGAIFQIDWNNTITIVR